MSAAWKWVTSVVVGGIALGSLLGAAAHPRIKDPPLQWWQLTGRDAIAAVNDQVFYESGPDDLSPHGGFRPDLDYDAEVWAAPIPGSDIVRYPDYLPGPPPVGVAVADDPPAPPVVIAQPTGDGEPAEAPAPEPAPDQADKAELAADGIW